MESGSMWRIQARPEEVKDVNTLTWVGLKFFPRQSFYSIRGGLPRNSQPLTTGLLLQRAHGSHLRIGGDKRYRALAGKSKKQAPTLRTLKI